MTHTGFRFIANLKPYTVHRGAGNSRFGAYLLSIDYARQLADLAREVLRDGSALCADNGNFDLTRDLIASNEPRARALDAERRNLLRSGTTPHASPADLPESLRARYVELAESVRAASAGLQAEARIRDTVRAQNALTPTYLIGPEDFTVNVLAALGIRPDVVSLGRPFYRQLARASVQLALDTEAGRFGASAPAFACVHAADYDTAHLAGEVAGKLGSRGIAASLAVALHDKTFVTFRSEAGKIIELGRTVPRPYVAVAEIVAGLHEGYVASSGRRPNFHGLGMGAPILLPLLAALGDGQTYTATDSTAPIVDGWSSPTISLYVDEPAPLKYKTYKIVETWLAGGRGWDCTCPYCSAFTRAFPPRIEEARAWWRTHRPAALTADSVRGNSPLADWLPLLGNAKHPGLRFGGAMARVGHNHWVLQRIEAAARRHATSSEHVVSWVDEVITRYSASAADPSWKAAVGVAWTIVRRAAERTRHAHPMPMPS